MIQLWPTGESISDSKEGDESSKNLTTFVAVHCPNLSFVGSQFRVDCPSADAVLQGAFSGLEMIILNG